MLVLCPAPLLDEEGSGDTQGFLWHSAGMCIGIGTKGAMAPPDFTCYDFDPPMQIMYLNLTTLYNELVYYLYTIYY